MKKYCLILALLMLLTGCSAAETYETLGDIDMTPVLQEERNVVVTVEEGAQQIRGESGTIYLCDGYTVTVEVLTGGNISATFQSLTGFGVDDLTVIETSVGDVGRFECVWTAAGEGGDSIGRAAVLDDGAYHYCITVQSAANDAAALQMTWQEIFDSFRLA